MAKKFVYLLVVIVLLLIGMGIGFYVLPKSSTSHTQRFVETISENQLENEDEEIREIEVAKQNELDNSDGDSIGKEGSLVLMSKYQENTKYFIEGYELVPYDESVCSKEGVYCEGIPELRESVSKFELASYAFVVVLRCNDNDPSQQILNLVEFQNFDLDDLCIGGHVANLFSYKLNEKGEIVFMNYEMI